MDQGLRSGPMPANCMYECNILHRAATHSNTPPQTATHRTTYRATTCAPRAQIWTYACTCRTTCCIPTTTRNIAVAHRSLLAHLHLSFGTFLGLVVAHLCISISTHRSLFWQVCPALRPTECVEQLTTSPRHTGILLYS